MSCSHPRIRTPTPQQVEVLLHNKKNKNPIIRVDVVINSTFDKIILK